MRYAILASVCLIGPPACTRDLRPQALPVTNASAIPEEGDALFPVSGEGQIPSALANAMLACEGTLAPCSGQLSRVVFTSRVAPPAYQVMRPGDLAHGKRNDGAILRVMTSADLREAEHGTAEVRFLHVEMTKKEAGAKYEVVTAARALARTSVSQALCGTERFTVKRDGDGWACGRRAPRAP